MSSKEIRLKKAKELQDKFSKKDKKTIGSKIKQIDELKKEYSELKGKLKQENKEIVKQLLGLEKLEKNIEETLEKIKYFQNSENIKRELTALGSLMKGKIALLKVKTRNDQIMGQGGFTLEEGYIEYVAKYQLVAFLEEFFKENPDKAVENPKTLFNKTKLKIIDYIFSNLKKEDIPAELSFFDKYPRPSNIPGQIKRKTGIEQLTDEEAQELMDRQDYSNIYEGKNPLGKFVGNEKIKLLDHQRKFLNGFFIGNLRSAVVFHGVGTGKTYSAVASAKLYLQLYPKGNVIVVCPPAVLFNFIDSMIKYGVNPQDRRFNYFSYTKFANNKSLSSEDSLIIIDEAHNLRTEVVGLIEEDQSGYMKYQKEMIQKGKRPASIIVKGAKARKIILLTATPFVNSPYDIENLLAIGDSRPPIPKKLFDDKITDDDFRYDYFKYKISKYERNFEAGDFPEAREKFIPIIESEDNDDIRAIGGEENAFYSASRQFSLTEDKIDYCINIIKDNPDKKFVIYSAYIFSGVEKIEKKLSNSGVKFGRVTGGMNVKTIAREIDGYNNFNNPDYQLDKNRVLLISKAGSEGVNLLETRGIFVIDGVWNEALYEQIVARAVRYKSHANLPKEEQYVDVYKLFTCYEKEEPDIKKLNEGKRIDFMKMIREVLKLRKGLSRDRKKINDAGEMTEDELENLKKKAVENMKKIPSTDFWMFLLQKKKEMIVDKFIKEIIRIPNLESSVEDIPEAKKLMKDLNAIMMNEKEEPSKKEEKIIEILKAGLLGKASLINKISKESVNNVKTLYETILGKKLDIQFLGDSKNYTPDLITPKDLVKKLVDISGIKKENLLTRLDVLDASSGVGVIANALLLVASSRKLNMKLDLVERNDICRIELQKLMDLLPTVVSLEQQKDYLSFLPSRRYNYIFCNPPQQIEAEDEVYNRKVFDYEYILRSWALLKLDGVLVAVLSDEYKKNKAMVKFLKDNEAEIESIKDYKWKGTNNVYNINIVYLKKINLNSQLDNSILETTGKTVEENEDKEVNGGQLDGELKEKLDKQSVEGLPMEMLPTVMNDYIEMEKYFDDKTRKFPVFVCNHAVQYFMVGEILKTNDNDCNIQSLLLRLIDRDKEGEFGFGALQLGRTGFSNLKADFPITYERVVKKCNKYGLPVGKFNSRTEYGGYNWRLIDNDGFDKLVKAYLACKKSGLIMAVPLTIGDHGGHANLLIINHYTKTFERYEPHGSKSSLPNTGYGKSELYDKILIYLMNYFNKVSGDKFKYFSPAEVCPVVPKITGINEIYTRHTEFKLKDFKKKFKEFKYETIKEEDLPFMSRVVIKNKKGDIVGRTLPIIKRKTFKEDIQDKDVYILGKFQSINKYYKNTTKITKSVSGFQSLEGKAPKQKDIINDRVIFEVGGYCCMWSLFMMDLRLKFPKTNPQELLTKALKRISENKDDNNNPYRNFIRGYTQDIMNKLRSVFPKYIEALELDTGEKDVSTGRKRKVFYKIVDGEEVKTTEKETKLIQKMISEENQKLILNLYPESKKKLDKLIEESGVEDIQVVNEPDKKPFSKFKFTKADQKDLLKVIIPIYFKYYDLDDIEFQGKIYDKKIEKSSIDKIVNKLLNGDGRFIVDVEAKIKLLLLSKNTENPSGLIRDTPMFNTLLEVLSRYLIERYKKENK